MFKVFSILSLSISLFYLGCIEKSNEYSFQYLYDDITSDSIEVVFLKNEDTLLKKSFFNLVNKYDSLNNESNRYNLGWSCLLQKDSTLTESWQLFDEYHTEAINILSKKENYKNGEEKKIIEIWKKSYMPIPYISNYDTAEWRMNDEKFKRFISQSYKNDEQKRTNLDSCEYFMYLNAFNEISTNSQSSLKDKNTFYLTVFDTVYNAEVLGRDFYRPYYKIEFNQGEAKVTSLTMNVRF